MLVNRCQTREISIQRGLKQGDPLTHLIFLLVVEGLSCLFRKAVELGLFVDFTVGASDLVISYLHYTNDTIIVAYPTVDNIWTIKAILRGFELASGLQVNFSKSSLIGVKVDHAFLENVGYFLHCRIETLPFKYLGIAVGVIPSREVTWDPLVNLLSKRPNSWKHKFIS